jgi:hypothetical protein
MGILPVGAALLKAKKEKVNLLVPGTQCLTLLPNPYPNMTTGPLQLSSKNKQILKGIKLKYFAFVILQVPF